MAIAIRGEAAAAGLKHFPSPSRLASLEDFINNREADQEAYEKATGWEHNSR